MLSTIFCLLAWLSFYAPQQTPTTLTEQARKPETPSAPPTSEKKKRAAEIESLVGEARLAPPEFAADALIRVAASSRVTEKEWKRELHDAASRDVGVGSDA